MSEVRKKVEVVNQRGLHARASAKFVGAVAEIPESCRVRVSKGENEAAGGSIEVKTGEKGTIMIVTVPTRSLEKD